MSYQVIARKWRPQKFDDVVGQQAVTRTLRNALASGRLAQAFVFAGPRGVGKTTTARILARALNCQNGPTPDPCGICDACKEIADGRDIDVLEIDAATHTGIDNIREVIISGSRLCRCGTATRCSSSTRSTSSPRSPSTRC
jgi:DNA polymerase-3 subunit gamma/tau